MAGPSSLPKILCLHGGGTNTTIFTIQLIRLSRILSTQFTFHFLDAPFESTAGPGVLPFFEGCEPFLRWANWGPGIGSEMPEVTRELVEKEVARLEQADGEGKVVGVLGFSQGAKLAAGLLCNQQLLSSPATSASPDTTASKPASNFKFGVFLNGTSPPLFSVSPAPVDSSTISPTPDSAPAPSKQPLITIPSLHILGTEDPWRDSTRSLFADYFDPKTAELVELNCGHRLPTKEEDTMKIAEGILRLWGETRDEDV